MPVLRITPNHGCQNGNGALRPGASANARLKCVIKYVVSGAHFICICEFLDNGSCGSGADAADEIVRSWLGNARAKTSQRFAFLAGNLANLFRISRVV